MAKLTLTDLTSSYRSNTALNANQALIEVAVENTLSRDGTAPNAMAASLDMGTNRVINQTDPVNAQDGATKNYVDGLAGTIADINAITQADGMIIVSDGTNWAGESGATLRTSIGFNAVPDTELKIADDGDATKLGAFQLSGLTTGNTRTLTWPDFDGTIATLAGTGTLTNKVIDSATNTLTLDLFEGTLTGTTAEFNTALSDGDFATLAGTEALTDKTLTSPVLDGTLSGTAFLDEDDMTSNSATKLASQQSIKAYVDTYAGVISVDTIAALKALTVGRNDVVNVEGHTTAEDGGGGLFRYNSGSSATDDNGITIAPTAGSGRWIRQYEGAVNVRYFGATGDGSTDDYTAIAAAVTAAKGSLYFPEGTYQLGTTLSLSQSENGLTLVGAGAKNTYLRATHSAGAVVELKGFFQGVEKLTVTSSSGREAGSAGQNYGILVDAPDTAGQFPKWVRLNHIEVREQPSHGIVLVSFCTGLTLTNFALLNNLGHGLAYDNGTMIGRVNIYQPGMITIKDGEIKDNDGHGVRAGMSGTPKTITAATQANPVVITAASHSFPDGETVFIENVVGMTEINDRYFKIANGTTNTFELVDEDGTGHTSYSSAGTVTHNHNNIAYRLIIDNVDFVRNATSAGVRTNAYNLWLFTTSSVIRNCGIGGFAGTGSPPLGDLNPTTGAVCIAGRSNEINNNRYVHVTQPAILVQNHSADLTTRGLSCDEIYVIDPGSQVTLDPFVEIESGCEDIHVKSLNLRLIDSLLAGTNSEVIYEFSDQESRLIGSGEDYVIRRRVDTATTTYLTLDNASNKISTTGESVATKSAAITIATGSAAVSATNLILAAETGTSDLLFNLTGGTDGQIIVLQADSGDTITVKNTASPSAGTEIKTGTAGDRVLTSAGAERLVLRYADNFNSVGAWLEDAWMDY